MLRKRVPNGRCSKEKGSAAHSRSDIRHSGTLRRFLLEDLRQGWRTFSASRANIQILRVTKVLACQNKKIEYWAILVLQTYFALYRGVGSLFSHVGQQSKSGRIESDRGVHSATQSAMRDLECLKLHQRVWGGAPLANGFLEIFTWMELVLINCFPCQKDCIRFWTSWWSCIFK